MNSKTHAAHILIVEDDKEYAKALKRILDTEFALVDIVANCAEALTRTNFISGLYDVIIMDQNLGTEVDGIQCMQEIKEVNRNIETIMLTGYGERDLALEAMRDGAFRYFYKPANDDELIATIYIAYELVNLRKTNVILRNEESEWRSSAIRLLLAGGMATLSIIMIAIFIRDNFVTAIIAFVATLIILVAGWQGFEKVFLKVKHGKDSASLQIETKDPFSEDKQVPRKKTVNKP